MKALFTAREWLFLAIIGTLNLILLLIGLNGASPFALEPDECDYGPHAIWMLIHDDLNPRWFVNPASTLYYPLLAYYALLRLLFSTQLIDPIKDEMRNVYEHMDLLIKVPRLVDVLITIGTLPFIYLVGRKWLGKGPAIVATIMFAICPEAIRYGQTLRTDPLTDFFVVLGMLLVVKAAEEPEKRSHAIWGAVVTALATSTRYFGLALTAPFVTNYALSFWQTKRLRQLFNLALYAVLVPVMFFCFSPFVILDFRQTLSDLHFEAFSDFPEVSGFGFFGNLSYYAMDVMPFCFGWIMTVAVPIGLVLVVLKKRSNLTASFILMLLGFFIGTCLNPRHWYRWLLPMVPGCSMLAGFALFVLFELLEKALTKISQPAVAKRISLTIVSVIFAISLIEPLENDYLMELDKIRPTGLAQMWSYIHAHIPEGTKIATDLDWRWTGKWLYKVQENVWRPDFIPPRPHNYRSPSDLARDGYEYVTCERWNRTFFQREVEKYPIESHFYSELRKHARMLYATKLNTEKFPGGNSYNRYSSYEIYDLRPLVRGSIDPNEQLNPPDDD